MKTPDEIKNGLKFCTREHHSAEPLCRSCPYDDGWFDMVACTGHLSQDALAYIRQLEASYSQVSKALCGKETATLEEVLLAVSQLKQKPYVHPGCRSSGKTLIMQQYKRIAELEAELASVKRERDAAKSDLCNAEPCFTCLHFRRNGGDCGGGSACREAMGECIESNREYTGNVYEWRGVCKENTEVQNHE